MISDILFDAVHAIDVYLNDPAYDEVYEGEDREMILLVGALMTKLAEDLETPPPGAEDLKALLR